MDSNAFTGRASKGSVSIENFQGRLRLHLPREFYRGKNKYLTLGLADTPNNRTIAEFKVKQINFEIVNGIFDPNNLERYKPGRCLKIVEPVRRQSLSLLETWDKYVDFKRPSISPSYLAHQLQATRNHLKKLSDLSDMDAVAVRNWAMANLTVDSAKRFITQLSACYGWAKKSRLIDVNPFALMASEIKLPRSEKVDAEDAGINPFTAAERDAIVQAFKTNQFCHACTSKNNQHSNYAAYVQFLFYTGCRPSEAIGLQWKNIDIEKCIVLFDGAVVQSLKGLVRKKGLKTQAFRKLKINGQLREILESIRPKNFTPDSLVFPAPEGGFIIQGNFGSRVWKKVLQGLGLEYRVPYQTRHTFITLCLDKGIDAKDVARWVGNSPEIIYRHYAGNRRDLQVPEI
jgi:integrase